MAEVTGLRADVERVSLEYVSLLAQALGAMIEAEEALNLPRPVKWAPEAQRILRSARERIELRLRVLEGEFS